MVVKPRMNKLERMWVRRDKLSNLLLREVCTISATEQQNA